MKEKLNKESWAIIELMIADGIISREDAEKYFPELKSKDRRIRKEIINFLKAINKDTLEGRNLIADRYGDAIPDDMIPTWIAWLEKQSVKFGVGDTIRLKGSLAEYTITSISDGAYHGNGWGIGFDCEDDYELVEVADPILPISIQKMVADYANNPEKGNEEFGKPVNCMVRAYKQGIRDALKTGEVKEPAKLSEEDLNRLEHALFGIYAVDVATKLLCKLKHQQHWSPTQQQMEALQVYLEHGCAAPDREACLAESYIISLQNDLKKLM